MSTIDLANWLVSAGPGFFLVLERLGMVPVASRWKTKESSGNIMADPIELRQAIKSFLGEATFRKWSVAYNARHRLRFWQEKEWGQFIAANPQLAITDDELDVVFRICHVHGDELQLGTANVFHGCRDFAPWYDKSHATLFPHATDDISTEGRDIPENTVSVFYCPTCRQAKQQWWERRRPPAY